MKMVSCKNFKSSPVRLFQRLLGCFNASKFELNRIKRLSSRVANITDFSVEYGI